jgi:2-polyprenyl-3-methyl-5-hydroxy-6-metoxy-1,4-benzoquinol methylase
MIFQNEMMDEETTYNTYVHQYRKLTSAGDVPSDRDIDNEVRRGKLILNNIKEYFWPNNEPLKDMMAVDIGSSTGTLVYGLSTLGAQSFGVEIGPWGEVSKKHLKIDVRKNIADFNMKFDLFTLIHTLEHFNDPRTFLDELHDQYATEGAQMYIEVPDVVNHQTGLGAFHPVMFSKKTLEEMLAVTGWRVDRIWNENSLGALAVPCGTNIHVFATRVRDRKKKPSKAYFTFERHLLAQEVNRVWSIRMLRRLQKDAKKQKKTKDAGGNEVVSEVRTVQDDEGISEQLRILPEVQTGIPERVGQHDPESKEGGTEEEDSGHIRGRVLPVWDPRSCGADDPPEDRQPPRVG